MPVNGVGLASVAFGGVFLYAGIKGYSVPQAFQAILTGKSPTTLTNTNPITNTQIATGSGQSAGSTSTAGIGPTAGANAISQQAVRYAGHCYKFGGAPGRDGRSCWDCSSFVNWVVGHDIGLAIPGYGPNKYTGSVHGPATVEWMVWSGCVTIKSSQAQPGDILVTSGHMGIYIGNGQMVSALNEHLGTLVTSIRGAFGSSTPTYRRLRLCR